MKACVELGLGLGLGVAMVRLTPPTVGWGLGAGSGRGGVAKVKVGSAGAPLLRGVDCAAQLDAPRPHLLLSRLGRAQRVVRLRSLRRLELGEGLRRVRLGLGARLRDVPAYPPPLCGAPLAFLGFIALYPPSFGRHFASERSSGTSCD